MPGFHLFFIFHVVVWDDIVVCIGPCVSGTGRVGAWRGSAGGDAPGRRALQQLPRPWAAARMPPRHRSTVVRVQLDRECVAAVPVVPGYGAAHGDARYGHSAAHTQTLQAQGRALAHH